MEPIIPSVTVPQVHIILKNLGSGQLHTDLKSKENLVSYLFNKTFKKETLQELQQTEQNLQLARSAIINEISSTENLNSWQNELNQAILQVSKRHFKTPEKEKAREKIQDTLQEFQTSILKQKMERYIKILSPNSVNPSLSSVTEKEFTRSIQKSEKILGTRYILKQEDKEALSVLLANPFFKEQFDSIVQKTAHCREKNLHSMAQGIIPHEEQAWNKDLLAHLAALQGFTSELVATGLFADTLSHTHINTLLTEIVETAIPYSDQVLKDTLAIGILGNVFTELLSEEQALKFKQNPQSVPTPEPRDRMGVDGRAWQSYYANKNLLAFGHFEEDPERAHYHERNLSRILQRTTWHSIDETREQAFISGVFKIGFRTDDDRLTSEHDIRLDLTELIKNDSEDNPIWTYKDSYEIIKFIWRLEKDFAQNEQWVSDLKFGRNYQFSPSEEVQDSYNRLKDIFGPTDLEKILRIAATFVYDLKYRFVQSMLALQNQQSVK